MTELTELTTPTDCKTLSQRLSEGRLPATEGLRYAMILAETLRRMHEEGRAHGAVAPGNIAVTETGLELQGSHLTPTATSYAAPEVLDGRTADARSDIFSFGAVLYEILTGRAPYQGKDRTTPLPSGSPAVDRLVGSCLVADPAARCQRMQKVMLELKLLSAAASRAAVPPLAHRDAVAAEAFRSELAQMEVRLNARLQAQEKRAADWLKAATEALTPPDDREDVRASMLQMESRMAGRLQAVDKKVAEIQNAVAEALYREPEQPAVAPAQLLEVEARVTARVESGEQEMSRIERAAGEATNALREQMAALREQMAAAGSQIAAAEERAAAAEQNVQAAGEQVAARVGQRIDALSDRVTLLEEKFASFEQRGVEDAAVRIEIVEGGLEALRKQTTELHNLVAEDMLGFEQSLKSQAAAIESARTAMAQTDDLVERVVEALESLQSTVLDRSEDRAVAVN